MSRQPQNIRLRVRTRSGRSGRAKQLTAIDEGWNCPRPLDWQRHHRVLADLVDGGGHLPDIAPGVLMDGDDIGRWLQRQTQPGAWAQLSTGQQERLTLLGIKPVETPSPAPAVSRAAKGPEQGAASVPAGPCSPHAVGANGKARTGRCQGATASRPRSTARPSR
ncbi:hypothetical protein GCM10010446_25500 [Streptomyces enissocaesilis]|uniref:Helicase-associated domain-containing protein n=1 Tax=Streptomyces enissocaesilis TaxID=332589 RepID=A0ABN3X6V1_9ACTN